jgi:MinD-like ATPase involved in chromosome partitioning or flagellar assembly
MDVNRGKPVTLAEPGADFSKAIRALADNLAGVKGSKGRPVPQAPRQSREKAKKDKQPRQSIFTKLRS